MLCERVMGRGGGISSDREVREFHSTEAMLKLRFLGRAEGTQSCHTEQCCLDVTRQADGLSEEL